MIILLVEKVLLPYEITLFSNWCVILFALVISFTTLWNYTILKPFYKSYINNFRFTTLWNYTILKHTDANSIDRMVLLPYEITLFSNFNSNIFLKLSVLLPYEITLFSNNVNNSFAKEKFYYLMKLHYSQTSLKVSLILSSFTTLWNYTILKLLAPLLERTSVLLPYEITLFSNRQRYSRLSIVVLLPYEITLFSNPTGNNIIHITVLLPYEITLFSNVSP